ncbi:hypothetical protein N0V84_004150 [Fusarium piperis]|uniref:Berberine/berberine-like domain-containing protein n=1 Tax=Fusarium piperis TaxID=1435070 RepID=A0A9W8WG53_9HYPO|nr:hypothetical protein N0V84_004150 [Fusarium piperis]
MAAFTRALALASGVTVAPAAEAVGGGLQLTDAVLANLTELELDHIELFQFADESEALDKRALSALAKCKSMPGDLLWPGKLVWKVFDLLTGDDLIKTVPFGAVCFPGGHYDANDCSRIVDNWTNSDTQIRQVLSVDIVTPDGRFITANEKQNAEIFWPVRGGGGATFGVVISLTVRVWPNMTFSGVTWSLSSEEAGISKNLFWEAMRIYWAKFSEYSDNHTYGYSTLFSTGPGKYLWSMKPWLVSCMELPEFKAMVSPLFKEWKEVDFEIEPEWFTHDNFYDTWKNHFPTESVSASTVRTASRLIPRKNFEDVELLNKTMDTVQSIVEDGSRDTSIFAIVGAGWSPDSSPADILATNKKITNDWMERLREVTPRSGGYGNEGDVMEPNFGQAFYGSENYKRLYALKKKLDPWGVFYALTADGSEDWEIVKVPGLLDGLLYGDLLETLSSWLALQTGRLCRK